MNKEEAAIQASIVKLLNNEGIFFFSIPNEGAGKNPIRQMQLIAMGLRSGVADLEVWWPKADGQVQQAYLEIKTKHGKQTVSQKKFEAFCRLHRIPYTVVRSLEEVEEIINQIKASGIKWKPFQKEWENC